MSLPKTLGRRESAALGHGVLRCGAACEVLYQGGLHYDALQPL